MRLEKIIIKNYKSIENISIENLYNKNNGLNILLGINEVGKTCILEAINLLQPTTTNPNTGKNHNYQLECYKPAQDTNTPIEIFGYFSTSRNTQEQLDTLLETFHLTPTKLPSTLLLKTTISNTNTKTTEFYLDDIFVNLESSSLLTDIKTKFNNILKEKVHINFWKYEDKYLIGTRIDLNTFKTNPDISIPLKNMFSLIKKYNKADITKAIDTALGDTTGSKKAELKQNLSDATTSYINRIWKKHNINIVVDIDATMISVYVEDKDAKNKYLPMTQRSDGFKQMISIILSMSCQVNRDDFRNHIILIDEPEIHLHPKGCEDVLEELKKWGGHNLVFVSTHSIFIFDSACDERHLIVSKQKYQSSCERIDHGKSIFDDEVARRAHGMNYWRKVLPSNLVLTEGISDKNLIEFFVSKLYPGTKFATKPGNGDKIVVAAQNYKNDQIPILILLDDDDKGREYKSNILSDPDYEDKVFTIKDLNNKIPDKSSIEDLLPVDILNKFFTDYTPINYEHLNIQLDESKPIIEQIKDILSIKGKDKKASLLDAKTELAHNIISSYSKKHTQEIRSKFPRMSMVIDKLHAVFKH